MKFSFLKITILLILLILTSGCSKNPMAGGDGTSTIIIPADSSINLPDNFYITAYNSNNNSISLNWSSSNKATSYIVKYKTANASNFSENAATTNLSDSVLSINNGVTYTVKIVAVNNSGTTESNIITTTPVNNDVAPVASSITPSGVVEDTSSTIQLSYSDANGDLATSCTISAATNITITNACTCNAGGFCSVGIQGNSNYNGSASFHYTVTANGATSNVSTASFFIAAVNDAPTISAIANHTTDEDVATGAIAFTINDVDSTLNCSTSVTSSSSNTSVLANSGIVIGGTAPNCTVTLTPVAHASGTATVNLTVSDGALSDSKSFSLIVNAVNNAPTISSISNQTTNEDTNTNAISFTITDIDSTLTCAGSVSKASSNTSLVDNSGIVIAGTAPNCTVTISPIANAFGNTNITLTVSDGQLTAAKTFTLTVNAVNDAPVISTINGQATLENQTTSAIPFTISDVDNTLTCTGSVTGSSSNTSILANAGIVIGGTAPNCTVTLTPMNNANGVATITLAVSDGSLTTNSQFTLSIGAVNQPPTISTITSKSTNEDTSINSIAFTISDPDNVLTCSSSVSASSSNTSVLANAGTVISGTAPNCLASITPVLNANGSSTVSLTVTDGSLTATSSFALTVNAVNDAPTISFISNSSTNEDVPAVISFTINDVDSSPLMSCTASNISIVSSSNTTLVPGIIGSDIIIGGTYPNCTATITPAAYQNGTTSLIFRITDNGAPGSPLSTDSNAFILTVNAVNNAPIISTIAAQTTNEDTSTSAIAFTINDVDNTLTCAGSVTKSSSNTALIANSGIVIGGTAPNCTVTITPIANANGSANITLTVSDGTLTAANTFTLTVTAVNDAPTISTIAAQTINEDTSTGSLAFTINDVDSTLTCTGSVSKSSSNTAVLPNSSITIAGTYPNCTVTATPPANMSGTTTITLTVFDGQLSNTSSFLLTVNAVNDAPTITSIGNQTTNEDTALTGISFTIDDVDSALNCTTSLSGSSSNTSIIANSGITFAGTYPNCTVSLSPVANANGTANITVTVSDTLLTASTTFSVTVNAVNDAPTISSISAKSTNEDTTTSAIAFTIADVDSTLTCTGSVTASSSDTTLIPNANIVIAGTAPNCTATITPAANANGSANITLTVSDTALTATSTFTLTVNAVNDAPTMTAITAKTTDEDASIAIPVKIYDIDSTLNCATSITMSSTNTTAIPNANVSYSGTAPDCIATITPASNKNGNSTITFTVSDTLLTASQSFVLTITPVPDISGTLTVTSNLSGVASSYNGNTYGRTLKFTGLTVDEAITSLEVCLGTSSGSCDVATWVTGTGYTTSGTAPTISLGGTYKLTSGVGGAQSFSLTPSCSTTTNYYYSIRVTNSSARTAIISTPAWSFWEPTCLGSSLAQWLDASETSSITVVSNNVSAWSDKSSNGRSLSQATPSIRPAYSSSGLGTGYPAIDFSAGSTYLQGSPFMYAFGTTSVFATYKGGTGTDYLFSEVASNSTDYYTPLSGSSGAIRFRFSKNGTSTSLVSATSNSYGSSTPATKLLMVEDTGSSVSMYSNGLTVNPSTTSYTAVSITMTNFYLGARITSSPSYASGQLAEFIITNGILSSADRQKLEGYSAHKWGLTGNLSSGHTWKNYPP